MGSGKAGNQFQRLSEPDGYSLSHKGDKEALKLKSDFIITLCDLIAGGKDGLENDEKGIIDECIRHSMMPILKIRYRRICLSLRICIMPF